MSRLVKASKTWFTMAFVWFAIVVIYALVRNAWEYTYVLVLVAVLLPSMLIGFWRRFAENLSSSVNMAPSTYVRALTSGTTLKSLPPSDVSKQHSAQSVRPSGIGELVNSPGFSALAAFAGQVLGACITSGAALYISLSGDYDREPDERPSQIVESALAPTEQSALSTPEITGVDDGMGVQSVARVYLHQGVQAEADWQDTSVYVREGELVDIGYIRGTWQPWPGASVDGRGCITGAMGCSDWGGDHPANHSSEIAHGGLIARIGEGQVRAIGNAASFTSPVAGHLYLRMNDNHFSDNSGSIRVAIVVEDQSDYPRQIKRIRVQAQHGQHGSGISTGIAVSRGEVIRIDAEGEWCWGPGDAACSNADGTEGRPNEAEQELTLMPNGNFGQLVAIVGDESVLLGVDGYYPMPGSGLLVLAMNDRSNSYSDNEGSLVVEISRPRPVESTS